MDILDHTAEEKVKLIPAKFINYLKENAAKDYVANLDYSKTIDEMDTKIETKGILGTICCNWWWNEDEKREYARLVREKEIKHQEELREKYNPNDIFKKKENKIEIQQEEVESNVQMVVYKENIFIRFFNKIKNFFRKK